MNNQILKLHPRSYREVNGRLIFYLDKRYEYHNNGITQEIYEAVLDELLKSKALVVTAYRKSESSQFQYTLYVGQYCMSFSESTTENMDFYSSRILRGKAATRIRQNLYKKKVFTIIPKGGVYVIYNNQMVPASDDIFNNDWSMDSDVYNGLVAQMEQYFESDEEENEDEKQEKITIKERFRKNVLKPFQDYTDKEDWVEKVNQAQGEGVLYHKRKYKSKHAKGSIYDFYSNDPNADPENNFLVEGSRVSIIDENGTMSMYTGIVQEVDAESAEDIVVSISFYQQSDDADIPERGKLILAVNDTQTRVRSRVIRSMERTRIESTYMYRTFNDFSVAGYEEPEDDLATYLAGKMRDKFPPNQMQMEAIIKGILTEDLLLVLGPPGTGKTTVISQWVEYFISHGKRVLISSQNNAAVDNVLARFKGKGEIVRLGNENKVQEDCKEFLPHNKLETMRNASLQNEERVRTQFAKDKQQIALYKERLQEGINASLQYIHNYKESCTAMGDVVERLRYLHYRKKEVEELQSRIENIIETRSHKRIFLEESEKKNPIIRFFIKRYIKHAREELKESEEQLIYNIISFDNTKYRKKCENFQKT